MIRTQIHIIDCAKGQRNKNVWSTNSSCWDIKLEMASFKPKYTKNMT